MKTLVMTLITKSTYNHRSLTQLLNLLFLLSISPICELKYDYLRKTIALEAFSNNPDKSMVLSTLLLRFPLCKLAAHIQGYAKNELLSILGIKSHSTLQNCYASFADIMIGTKDLDLIMVNKIIINHATAVRTSFISNSTDFGVKVDQIGFNNPQKTVSMVNQWIDRASFKRLTNVLDITDINNKTSILIVSAAYLKITWEFPFDIRFTKNVKFHHHDGNISMVPMMKRAASYLYLDDPITGALFVNLKLAAFGLSLTVVVPSTPRNLSRLIRQLSSQPDILQGVYKRMQYENINVMLPRFKIKSCVDWNKYLRNVGLLQIFNETNSGLNEILTENSETKNIYLSKVKQKSFIEVDEMGIFRQKINNDRNIFNNPYALRDNRGPLVMANKPFLFAINLQNDPTNRYDMHELFTGVYYGPQS